MIRKTTAEWALQERSCDQTLPAATTILTRWPQIRRHLKPRSRQSKLLRPSHRPLRGLPPTFKRWSIRFAARIQSNPAVSQNRPWTNRPNRGDPKPTSYQGDDPLIQCPDIFEDLLWLGSLYDTDQIRFISFQLLANEADADYDEFKTFMLAGPFAMFAKSRKRAWLTC